MFCHELQWGFSHIPHNLMKNLKKIIFQKEDYGTRSVTMQGEEVKSLGERRIANFFTNNRIIYVYEKKAKSKGTRAHQSWRDPERLHTNL